MLKFEASKFNSFPRHKVSDFLRDLIDKSPGSSSGDKEPKQRHEQGEDPPNLPAPSLFDSKEFGGAPAWPDPTGWNDIVPPTLPPKQSINNGGSFKPTWSLNLF